MFRKLIIPAALGLTALAAIVPGAASAQSYGGWTAREYSDGGYGGHHDDRYGYDDRGDYRARQRWVEHRRWEEEARRRYWERQRWERARYHRDWDGDGRGW